MVSFISGQMSNYQKTDLNTEAYEPFMLEDKQAGEVHWLFKLIQMMSNLFRFMEV